MEIKNNLNQLDPYNRTKLTDVTGQTARKDAAPAATAPETGDRVSLSHEAKLRTEAFTTAMSAPDIRAEKVAELKAQVEAGTYTVDSKAVAAKLLEEEPGLFQP